MPTQNIKFKLLADVAGADASFRKLRNTLSKLSNGTLTLGKNMRVFEKGTRGSISAEKAMAKIAKAATAELKGQLEVTRAQVVGLKSLTEFRKAEAATIRAQVDLLRAKNAIENQELASLERDIRLKALAVRETETMIRAKSAEIRMRQLATSATHNETSATRQNTDAQRENANVTGAAVFALTSLGQGLSDAGQFGVGFAQGIRAITNNVQQVGTGLFFLKTQLDAQKAATGVAQTAFQALKGALTGPLGVLFALQAVTAAMELFANLGQGKGKKGIDNLRLSIEDLFDVLRNAPTSVPLLEKSIDDALERADKEIKANTAAIVRLSNPRILGADISADLRDKDLRLLKERNKELKKSTEAFREDSEARKQHNEQAKAAISLLSDEELAQAKLEKQNRELAKAMESVFTQRERDVDSLGKMANALEDLPVVDIGDVLEEAIGVVGTEAFGMLNDAMKESADLLNAIKLNEGEVAREIGRVNKQIKIRQELLRVLSESPERPDLARFRGSGSISNDLKGDEEKEKERKKKAEAFGRSTRENLNTELQTIGDMAELKAQGTADALARIQGSFGETILGMLNNNADTIIKVGGLIGNSLGQAGDAFSRLAEMGAETNGRLFTVGKAFGIAEAVVNTAVGITRAFRDVPFPLSLGVAATIAATGAAQIATIAAAKPGSSGVSGTNIGSAPNRLGGITNIRDLPGSIGFTGQDASSVTGISQRTEISGQLVASGRSLVALISNEVAAQRRQGISDPLGIAV